MTAKTYQDYFDWLGFKESSSIADGTQNYAIENAYGYIGKYQFGEAALFDLGYYAVDGSDSNLFNNDWGGHWSGKNGLQSKQDYLNNGLVQETIVQDWHAILWGRIKYLELDRFEGQVLNGYSISVSGMLAVAHLLGVGSRSSDTAGLKGYLLSGAAVSPEDKNGTTANEYMMLFNDFQTPFRIDHSDDEIIVGGTGKDILTGLGGNDTLNGEDGIDTAIYTDHLADYTVEKQSDESWIVTQKNSGVDGTDSLIHIERLQFSDTALALDLDTNAGMTAKILGAVFGPEAISNKIYTGIGLSLLDDGMDYATLMQLAINTALDASATNHTAVVKLLYQNVVGFSPPMAEEAYYVGLLDAKVHTVPSIGILAADSAINQLNINLIGLSQVGLEYESIAI